MADLPISGKVSEETKVHKTERKPIILDKPQDVSQQIQVHQGNIGVLQVKLLEMLNVKMQKLIDLMEKK